MVVCPHCGLPGSATSKIPSVEQCRTRCDSHCQACQRFLEVELKLEEARRTLKLLVEENAKLASVFNEHHDPFIHRLPVEIVSHIFIHSLPYSPSLHVFDSPFDEQSHTKAVFNLIHVTHNWRNIAYHTPALWSIFSVTITENNCVNAIAIAQDWLKRSGQLDLFLKLRIPESLDMSMRHSVQRFTTSIGPHAHRWKVLHLRVHSLTVPELSSAVSNQNLDRLEYLYSDFSEDEPEEDDESHVLKLSCSPRLLTVDGGWKRGISIGWDRLTHFSSSESTPFLIRECVYLFRSARNLVRCTFGRVYGSETESGTPVKADYLEELRIGFCDAQFWDTFTFPSLNTLHLTQGPDYQFHEFRDFLRRSDCRIKILSVYEGHDSDFNDNGDDVACISKFLTFMPHLEHFNIQGVIGGPLLLLMNTNFSIGLLDEFPRGLRSISFLGSSHQYFDWTSLMAFLVTRKLIFQPLLESVTVQYRDVPSDTDLETHGDRRVFKLLLDAVCGLEFRLVDMNGGDVLEKLRRYQNL